MREGEVSLNERSLILNTLRKDPTRTRDEALRRSTSCCARATRRTRRSRGPVRAAVLPAKRYDPAEVGRYKLNHRLKLDVPRTVCTLTPADFLAIVREMILLFLGRGETDDIDHFGNPRVRSGASCGQPVLGRPQPHGADRQERMNLSDKEKPITPADLVNARTMSAVIQSTFGSSRPVAVHGPDQPALRADAQAAAPALGPGGLHRDRAGFEVRDVHYTHYGRMCPIETPEGPNIGLIASLATHARINSFGFIEAPYRRVDKGTVQRKIEYLTADQEDAVTIAQANFPLDEEGRFKRKAVLSRRKASTRSPSRPKSSTWTCRRSRSCRPPRR